MSPTGAVVDSWYSNQAGGPSVSGMTFLDAASGNNRAIAAYTNPYGTTTRVYVTVWSLDPVDGGTPKLHHVRSAPVNTLSTSSSVVDPDVAHLSGQRAGRRADRDAEQWHEEDQAEQHAPEHAAHRAGPGQVP